MGEDSPFLSNLERITARGRLLNRPLFFPFQMPPQPISHPMPESLTVCSSQVVIASSKGWAQLQTFLRSASKPYSSCIIISDEHVYSLYGTQLKSELEAQNLPVYTLILPASEQTKTLSTASYCWEKMHALGLDRHSLVIGLGGGMITDLAGYVAGCYMRGVDVVYIPTSLIGMVDAALGGKSGVNLAQGKNLVGLFHHPKFVLISPNFLKTLPSRDLRSGLAEVIKYGVIADAELFATLEREMPNLLMCNPTILQTIIHRSCAIKAEIVNADERDSGRRAILNWGHTFAHAIETATKYAAYSHGEAVAIGMSCAAYVSHLLGYVDLQFVHRQDTLCEQAGLPTDLPNIPLHQLIAHMRGDKKAISKKISLILAKGIGNVFKTDGVDEAIIIKALELKQKSALCLPN